MVNNNEEQINNFLNAWGHSSFYSDDEIKQLFISDGNDLIQEYRKDLTILLRRLQKEPYHQLLELGIRTSDRFKIGGALRTITAATPLRLPCLDNDLMDFCFSIPPALFNNRLLINLFLTQRSQKLAAIPLDQNSRRGISLQRGLKQELKYKLWCNYIERIKFPFLRITGYSSPLTTQCYVHSFSMKDQTFQEILNESINSLPSLKNILNINISKELLNRPLPKEDNHIGHGNAKRSLITVINIAKTFIS